ncbi:MAG TPA: NAD-dependent epimerase/dehydratase family protein [Kineosporiaceae bacterium]|nr:NAD-dependent epimerase/dehydratase family protein [Kineosporiaceae bacterium]
MGRVILVAGVSRYLGGRFARILTADPAVGRVIGVDVVPPPHDIGNADFVRADIRNPVIAKVISRANVDTVVHMNVIATPTSAGGRVSMKEINVIGTMQLLAACQKAPSVRRLVVKSTAGVYGSSARDPAMFTEDTGAKLLPRSGWGKDSVEVEGYVRGFSRRRPDVDVITLRLANFIGPEVRTALTDYFSLPVLPTVMGYDARLQFVHEDDGLEALRLAAVGSATGTINVAGDGLIMLSQAARLAGRPTVGIPPALTGMAGQLLSRSGLIDFTPEQMSFLSFGRGIDTSRMRRVLGFTPRFTTREAFEDFVRGRGLRGPLSTGIVEQVESGLLGVLRRLEPVGRSS